MTTEKQAKFVYYARFKYQLANLYDTSPKGLRRWLMAAPELWQNLNYDNSKKLNPAQIKKIVDHLGEPWPLTRPYTAKYGHIPPLRRPRYIGLPHHLKIK
jgi:hypothetical protein